MPEGDWHVDDICGHMPRYAHPIPYMHDTIAPELAALAAPMDRQFVVEKIRALTFARRRIGGVMERRFPVALAAAVLGVSAVCA